MFPYSLAGILLESDLLIFFCLLQIEIVTSWIYVLTTIFTKNTKLYVKAYKTLFIFQFICKSI